MNKHFYSLTPATQKTPYAFTAGPVEVTLQLPPRPLYYINLKKLCEAHGINYTNAYYALRRQDQDTYEVDGMTVGKHTML